MGPIISALIHVYQPYVCARAPRRIHVRCNRPSDHHLLTRHSGRGVAELQLLALRLDRNTFAPGLFPAAAYVNHSCGPNAFGYVLPADQHDDAARAVTAAEPDVALFEVCMHVHHCAVSCMAAAHGV